MLNDVVRLGFAEFGEAEVDHFVHIFLLERNVIGLTGGQFRVSGNGVGGRLGGGEGIGCKRGGCGLCCGGRRTGCWRVYGEGCQGHRDPRDGAQEDISSGSHRLVFSYHRNFRTIVPDSILVLTHPDKKGLIPGSQKTW